MAIIPQPHLFTWQSVDLLGDLDRLKLVLDFLPDEPLMLTLELHRAHGRNDYPVRPLWNSLLAAFVFQHPSIAALRRELLRNGQLRDLCGFDPGIGAAAVPTECAYTRFQKTLRDHQAHLDSLFQRTLALLHDELPDLGQDLALDGKELHSHARHPNKQQDPDGRRDLEAAWGVKGHGKKSWFGYLLHLIVDANYELPVAFTITTASAAEQPQAQRLLDQLQHRHPQLLAGCERLSADKGYDDHKLIARLWDQHQIKPIIAIRNCWRDGVADDRGEFTKVVTGQQNVTYTFDGQVSCVCPQTGTVRSMDYAGFERDRNTLKYRCPARNSGLTCAGLDQCPVRHAVRIPLAEDRRVFTPVARSCYAWQDYYDQRSAVERVNSRLAGPFGFERPFIRGLGKMRQRISMALTIMLAMALGRIRTGQAEHLRSLVRAA